MAKSQSHVLTDHDEIRKWAESRKAAPACVRGTGGKNDIGMLRLDFPGYSGQQSLEHIEWDEWFDKFDENGLALLVQDSTARGERSNFNKLVSRKTGSRNAGRGQRKTARKASSSSLRRNASRKSASAKRSSGRTTARKSASSRSRSTGRKSASRSTSSTNSRSRTAAKSSASTRSTATRSRRNTSSASTSRSRSGRRGVSTSARSGRAASHVLVDHDEIRRWAEDRNAEPACVRGTGGGDAPGMIRLDFPGYTGADSLERIDWEEWFRAFDENGLALVVQDTTSGGERSNFNKLVSRENAMAGSKRGSKSGSRVRASAGNSGTKKAARGSNRAQRTESARGRTTSQRRAA